MSEHRLALAPGNLHGSFDPSLPPAITVDPGDAVTLSTLDGDWLLEVADDPSPHHGRQWPHRRPGVDDGHALAGPIAVSGARPGQLLEVGLDRVVPGEWGWSRAGGRDAAVYRALGVAEGAEYYLKWGLDAASGIATSHLGHRVRMRPFLGVVGCAPNVSGPVSTHPPRRTGGNIDCRELIVGSSVFLPVEVPGALLSLGDGHAAQGDGEVGVTAIECPMREVRVTVDVHEAAGLSFPHAVTPAGWVVFGFSESLDRAAEQALAGMLVLLQVKARFGRKEALAIASQVVDLRVTQIVNGVKGVHAVIGHDALALSQPRSGIGA